MQNPKVTASVDRAHASAIEKLKTKWTVTGNRVFSRKFCDAAVLYGNLESSTQGKNLLLLLDRIAPELRFVLYPPEKIDRIIATVITDYLKFSGISFSLPETEASVNTIVADTAKDSTLTSNSADETAYGLSNSIQNDVQSTTHSDMRNSMQADMQDTTQNDEFIIDLEVFESLDKG